MVDPKRFGIELDPNEFDPYPNPEEPAKVFEEPL